MRLFGFKSTIQVPIVRYVAPISPLPPEEDEDGILDPYCPGLHREYEVIRMERHWSLVDLLACHIADSLFRLLSAVALAELESNARFIVFSRDPCDDGLWVLAASSESEEYVYPYTLPDLRPCPLKRFTRFYETADNELVGVTGDE